MSRPLVISDCDEVLLHMVAPFRDWLDETHGIEFRMDQGNFGEALRYRDSGALLEQKEIWAKLNAFFDSEMHRQRPIHGAPEAIKALSEHADVVILTNLLDHRAEARTAQLRDHGMAARVFTNQGPKGPALRRILDEYAPSHAVFIDDLAQHHASAAADVPEIGRLHFVGEAAIAPHLPCAHRAGDAHARIDRWDEALPWLTARLENGDWGKPDRAD